MGAKDTSSIQKIMNDADSINRRVTEIEYNVVYLFSELKKRHPELEKEKVIDDLIKNINRNVTSIKNDVSTLGFNAINALQ